MWRHQLRGLQAQCPLTALVGGGEAGHALLCLRAQHGAWMRHIHLGVLSSVCVAAAAGVVWVRAGIGTSQSGRPRSGDEAGHCNLATVGQLGIRTLLMMWMMPLEADLSVARIPAADRAEARQPGPP